MTDQGATEAQSVGRTLTTLVTGLDHLIKDVDDRGLEQLDDLGLIEFMHSFEQLRNRLSVVDHHIIVDGQRRDLPDRLCQGTMRRVLTSTLSLSKAEAGRRVRAAEAVGPRTSMHGETLEPVRPRLAAAQRDGQVSPEKVAIIARALGQVDRRGFDPADLDTGEKLLVEQAPVLPPEDLRILADRVVDAIDPDGTLPKDQLNQDRRHVEFHQRGDGSWAGTLRLTGALGSKLQALLGPLAKPRVNLVTGPDGRLIETPDERHHGQRMHDALEDVCDRMLRTEGAVPDSGGTPATVIITIDLEDLLNGTGYGITSDGTLIRTEQVRSHDRPG